MSASAKINYLDYWGDDLFASVTVTFDSADTMNAPEHWEITWEHFLPCLQRELKSYLQSYAPNFFEIWEAVNALTHPLCGRLFPEKKQLPSRPQLIHDYGCTLRDIGKLDPEACHRFGSTSFLRPRTSRGPRPHRNTATKICTATRGIAMSKKLPKLGTEGWGKLVAVAALNLCRDWEP